jgi:hypothetical protein
LGDSRACTRKRENGAAEGSIGMNPHPTFDHLARELTLGPLAAPDAVERLRESLEAGARPWAASLPPDYFTFVSRHNGAHGALGRLWRVQELGWAEDLYPALDHLTGFLVFGSDGQDHAFVFAGSLGSVVVASWAGGWDARYFRQGSFTQFTHRWVEGRLFEDSRGRFAEQERQRREQRVLVATYELVFVGNGPAATGGGGWNTAPRFFFKCPRCSYYMNLSTHPEGEICPCGDLHQEPGRFGSGLFGDDAIEVYVARHRESGAYFERL